jgi:hypothetical protein
MKYGLLFIILAVIILNSDSGAFDKSRRGFTLGLGLGVAPMARYSLDINCGGSIRSFSLTKPSIAFHLLAGYGWNERNVFTFELNINSVREDEEPCGPPPPGSWHWHFRIGPPPEILLVYLGPIWYHYLKPVGKSFLTIAGLGLAYHDSIDDTNPGLGILLGGGYDFGGGFIANVRYFHGTSKSKWGGTEYRLDSLSLLLSKMWY